MENTELSVDRDQSPLPEYKGRLPRHDKLRLIIEERLLFQPGSMLEFDI